MPENPTRNWKVHAAQSLLRGAYSLVKGERYNPSLNEIISAGFTHEAGQRRPHRRYDLGELSPE